MSYIDVRKKLVLGKQGESAKLVLDRSSKDSLDFEPNDNITHSYLRDFCKKYVKRSREHMSNNYDAWDYNDLIFRSKRKLDKEDRAAMLKGNTAKMIVPLTFSQVITFAAFCMATLQQNQRMYQLDPLGSQDQPLNEPLELILQRDLAKNKFSAFLAQFFIDIGRFSMGIGEVSYEEHYRYMNLTTQQPAMGPQGMPTTKAVTGLTPVPVFTGNVIRSVSPYRFFPDLDFPLARYQEGKFCFSEEIVALSTLRGWAEQMDLFNLDYIPKMGVTEMEDRKRISRIDEIPVRQNANMGSENQINADAFTRSGNVVLTKGVVEILHSDFKPDGTAQPLGAENLPVRYIVWYANDKTVVRFAEATFLHGQYPYFVSQYINDQHKVIPEGLSDLCDQLQEYITWLANSHKAAQANALESKWVVDPTGIDIKTLESRSPYIYMKRDVSGMDVRRYIQQFQTTDVTANAFADIGAAKDLMDSVTGQGPFMQGQSSPGRRSSLQDSVVTQGGASRGKFHLSQIWATGLSDLGKQLIANNRQEMDFATFSRILGTNPSGVMVDPMTGAPYPPEQLYAMFASDPFDIAAAEHFFIWDATLPSERQYLAQSLQEIFIELMQNPALMQLLGYGPAQMRDLFAEIFLLRGVPSSRLPAPLQPQMPGAPGQPPQPPGAPAPGAAPAAAPVFGLPRGQEAVPLTPPAPPVG